MRATLCIGSSLGMGSGRRTGCRRRVFRMIRMDGSVEYRLVVNGQGLDGRALARTCNQIGIVGMTFKPAL